MIKFGKKLKNVEKKIPLLVDEFSKRNDMVALYLFGSRATNTADDLSDIDIAILLKDKVHLSAELDLLGDINSLLNTDEIGLVILNNAPLVISYGVLKESKVLCSTDDNARLVFEEYIMKRYFDFMYYLDKYDKEFISFMKYGKSI